MTQIAKNESMKVIENEMMGDNFNDMQVDDLEALITTIDGIKSFDNQQRQNQQTGSGPGNDAIGNLKASHKSSAGQLIDTSSRVFKTQ